ncbi:hypothetical protein QR98_0097750 [Sarcoptes scabiei]|uniref:Tn3 transposase DDE domain-containing protein n=1 Tax=Sarcoptes scabiei TaxID=52283 RepID=A0A132AKV3_SARSC|nr:hypothetical protein QR98_0097750 [Sarcoptes scabiei]
MLNVDDRVSPVHSMNRSKEVIGNIFTHLIVNAGLAWSIDRLHDFVDQKARCDEYRGANFPPLDKIHSISAWFDVFVASMAKNRRWSIISFKIFRLYHRAMLS